MLAPVSCRCGWQLEPPAFEPLVPNGVARAIPIEDLHQIPAAIEKDEQMPGRRLLPKDALGQREQAAKTLPHVGRGFGEVHPGLGRKCEHLKPLPPHGWSYRVSPECDRAPPRQRLPEHESRARADGRLRWERRGTRARTQPGRAIPVRLR